jgi:hypothetical protein
MDIVEALEKSIGVNNYHKLKPCTRCKRHNFELRYAINKDGKECYPYFCVICNARSPILESRAYAKTQGFK